MIRYRRTVTSTFCLKFKINIKINAPISEKSPKEKRVTIIIKGERVSNNNIASKNKEEATEQFRVCSILFYFV